MHYKVVLDEKILDDFIATLPDLDEDEVWYACLFGRHKYDTAFPNTRDSGQLVRSVARDKKELKEKLRRMETPIGSYSRNSVPASQACLAAYISTNPRSLKKANQLLLVEMASRFAKGEIDFSPITLANTQIHRALSRKFYVDFDFDDFSPEDLAPKVAEILPETAFRILKTRGGCHVLVDLKHFKGTKDNRWYQRITAIGCDVRGSDALTPIPGCTQGGFCPHFVSKEGLGENAAKVDDVVDETNFHVTMFDITQVHETHTVTI